MPLRCGHWPEAGHDQRRRPAIIESAGEATLLGSGRDCDACACGGTGRKPGGRRFFSKRGSWVRRCIDGIYCLFASTHKKAPSARPTLVPASRVNLRSRWVTAGVLATGFGAPISSAADGGYDLNDVPADRDALVAMTWLTTSSSGPDLRARGEHPLQRGPDGVRQERGSARHRCASEPLPHRIVAPLCAAACRDVILVSGAPRACGTPTPTMICTSCSTQPVIYLLDSNDVSRSFDGTALRLLRTCTPNHIGKARSRSPQQDGTHTSG